MNIEHDTSALTNPASLFNAILHNHAAMQRFQSHQLSAEARQALADDFTAEMKQEARERREMDEQERGE